MQPETIGDTMGRAKETMLKELREQLAATANTRASIMLDLAKVDGEQDCLLMLIARLEQGLVNLITGELLY